jgi:serine/threonine-protein kinase RsbW
MKLELQATPVEVMRAVDAVRAFARGHGLSEKQIFGIAIALEECGSNIVNHALGRDDRKTFRVAFRQTADSFCIEFRDPGPEFDPTAIPPPSVAPDPDAPVGGWGAQLVRFYMDEIRYRREGGENILHLIKRLDAAGGAKPES